MGQKAHGPLAPFCQILVEILLYLLIYILFVIFHNQHTFHEQQKIVTFPPAYMVLVEMQSWKFEK